MQPLEGRLLVSAHDLVGFLGCEHVTVLDKEVVDGRRGKPSCFDDPQLKLLQKRGHDAVVLYSMATSSPEDTPRGTNFLYSGHRFNVAVSRARGLAVLLCSPDLLKVRCRTPEEMRLANALCRFVELSEEWPCA
jgi:superfamily I DNA and/or RNA helicase